MQNSHLLLSPKDITCRNTVLKVLRLEYKTSSVAKNSSQNGAMCAFSCLVRSFIVAWDYSTCFCRSSTCIAHRSVYVAVCVELWQSELFSTGTCKFMGMDSFPPSAMLL